MGHSVLRKTKTHISEFNAILSPDKIWNEGVLLQAKRAKIIALKQTRYKMTFFTHAKLVKKKLSQQDITSQFE